MPKIVAKIARMPVRSQILALLRFLNDGAGSAVAMVIGLAFLDEIR
jgi:hypothetical protein